MLRQSGPGCAARSGSGRPRLSGRRGVLLEPKAAKTRLVRLAVGGAGVDFLGFHHRLVRCDGRRYGKHVVFLAHWPANKAMQHASDRIRGRAGRCCCFPSMRRWTGSTGLSTAGPRTSGSAIPHVTLRRSGTTCGCGWRCWSASGTDVPGSSGARWCSSNHRITWDCSALTQSLPLPGRSGPGG